MSLHHRLSWCLGLASFGSGKIFSSMLSFLGLLFKFGCEPMNVLEGGVKIFLAIVFYVLVEWRLV